ncbi:MAG TPA: cytochrome c [Pyrinomonadaceae bacterium]|jgi:cytochrome c553|nr:cytochrome c [Pyrinomonadaceae bacterium]
MFSRLAKISAAIVAALFITLAFSSHKVVPAQEGSEVKSSDTAAFYKAKCVMCHGATAEKKFDAALPEDQMLDAILKGKKVEKPPHMPAYEAKGVSADDAKALIAHMKKLKEAPAN